MSNLTETFADPPSISFTIPRVIASAPELDHEAGVYKTDVTAELSGNLPSNLPGIEVHANASLSFRVTVLRSEVVALYGEEDVGALTISQFRNGLRLVVVNKIKQALGVEG